MNKSVPLALTLSFLLPACIVHIHGYDERTNEAICKHVESGWHFDGERDSSAISGTVRDGQGQPARARVAVVNSSGSMSSTTDDQGRFDLRAPQPGDCVLHASTEDGRIAVLSTHTGARDIVLELRPGSTIVIDLAGRDHTRCAIFDRDVRVEDFTLRSGQPARVVVPPGEVLVRLYDGDKTYSEMRVKVSAGASQAVQFKLES